MTIHRLMTAIATEQGRLHGDEYDVETTRTTDDRSDAAAEQYRTNGSRRRTRTVSPTEPDRTDVAHERRGAPCAAPPDPLPGARPQTCTANHPPAVLTPLARGSGRAGGWIFSCYKQQ